MHWWQIALIVWGGIGFLTFIICAHSIYLEDREIPIEERPTDGEYWWEAIRAFLIYTVAGPIGTVWFGIMCGMFSGYYERLTRPPTPQRRRTDR